MSPHEESRRRTQAPSLSKTSDNLRALKAAARRGRAQDRERKEDSAWRKRAAALMSGRFIDADGYTDEDALDAYAPHPSDGLRARLFTAKAEDRELAAWAKIEAVEQSDWPSLAEYRRHHRDACRAYLRTVEAADRATGRRLKAMSFGDVCKPSLRSMKFGGTRWRAA